MFIFYLLQPTNRYDKLVAELDEMVEAGCIIPTAEELQAAKVRGKMKKHSSSNASAKHKGGTSSSTSANQKTKMRYRSFTSGGSLTGGGSDSLDGGDGSSIELHDGSIEEAGVNTRNTGEQSGKDYRNPEGVKFQTRAQREDSDIEMQILENRAMRQGNVLSGEITHLRTVMDKMRADHEQALLRAEQSSKAAESGHNKLSAEVARLTAKVPINNSYIVYLIVPSIF